MKHARKDYDNIQDPLFDELDPRTVEQIREEEGRSPIGRNEPVMLFRAKDYLMPAVLDAYACMLVDSGNSEMGKVVFDFADKAREWQEEHGSKLPDLPGQNSVEANL